MRFTLTLALLAATGCGKGLHEQYDHGRAYREAFEQQPDLTRPEAQDDAYPLSGEEGEALRERVEETSTDAEEDEEVEE